MRTFTAVYDHSYAIRGESAPWPVCVYPAEASPDLSETTPRYSWPSPDSEPIVEQLPRYSVQTVRVPAWLRPDDWVEQHARWRLVWVPGGVAPAWPERWVRAIVDLDPVDRYLVARAVRSRSHFPAVAKAREAAERWLDRPTFLRASGKSPLSDDQCRVLSRGSYIPDFRRLAAALQTGVPK